MRRLGIFLRSIRVLESALMLGFPLAGTILATTSPDMATFKRVLLFLPPTYALVIYVYAYNSWGGIETDRRNQRLGDHPVLTGDITPTQLKIVAAVGLISSMALYAWWLPECLPYAAYIAVVWTLYSHPHLLAKGRPLGGTMVHLTGGVAQFLLGWIVARPVDTEAVIWACYFAGVFTAGHANHEVKDHAADKAMGLRTNAVVFGPLVVYHGAMALFAVCAFALLVAALTDVTPWLLAWPFLAIFPIHAIAHALWTPKAGAPYPVAYQRLYRGLFFVAGLAALACRAATWSA
ncbi:MAG: UbiA prenyltransferase family protein [Deltaproteobacteria bacterium]|nr:UbiA prenyltransferase family protein [Deltaproteobacteria bacterium]